eukprot:1665919-Alexandrium_andersonii.AAC.1
MAGPCSGREAQLPPAREWPRRRRPLRRGAAGVRDGWARPVFAKRAGLRRQLPRGAPAADVQAVCPVAD